MAHVSSRRTVRRLALVMVAAAALASPAAAAERPTDKDVKQLLERIDQDRDRFEDQLDGRLKDGIVRGPLGEVKVNRYLDDLQDNVDKLKERFSKDYAASAEATTVLRQGSDIQRFMAGKPADLDGASEWNRLAGSLAALADAYGTTFPIPDRQQARRMNDDEVRRVADAMAEDADRFKKELDSSLKRDVSVDKAAREAAVQSADDIKQDARRLASTIGDGRPASGEARALVQRVTAGRRVAAGSSVSSAAKQAWGAVEGNLPKVIQAFGLSAP